MDGKSTLEEVAIERIVAGTFSYKDDLSHIIRAWKNRYSGERCFVIGNGESLNEMPMDKLIGEHCMATNKISEIYGKTEWRPTLYQCMTTFNKENRKSWVDAARTTIELGIPSFILWKRGRFLGNYPNVIWTEIRKSNKFDIDLSKGMPQRGCSGIRSIHLAMYLGFNPIILVGFDGKFRAFDEGKDPNHFSGDYLQRVTEENAERWNREWPIQHAIIKGAADVLGIDIIDATIDGGLDIYQKENINAILRRDRK